MDTGLDLTLNEVQVGDEIAYGISALFDNGAVDTYLDVATVVGGVPTNAFGSRSAAPTSTAGNGATGWRTAQGVYVTYEGQAPLYTLAAGDIADGAVTLRFRYRTQTATARILYADASWPLDVWAWNMGPGQ